MNSHPGCADGCDAGGAQVYMLDKRQVDPRRPMGKQTAQDVEERLAPYQELLPLIPQGAITQNKQVARLSGQAPQRLYIAIPSICTPW